MRTRMIASIGALVGGSLVAALLTTPAAATSPTAPGDRRPVWPSLVGREVDMSLFGMHIIDMQNAGAAGSWPVYLGSPRLWDTTTSWADLEKAPGVFEWKPLDDAMAKVDTYGAGAGGVLMVLGGTPAWASTTPSVAALPYPGASGMPSDPAYWDQWVSTVVTRYQGRIKNWQIWNEANLQTFFTGTPAQMADMTKRAYDIIKGIDPTANVVAASTGTRLTSAFNHFYPAYLQELKARGWPVDVYAAHTYPASLGTPIERKALIQMWIDALRAAGAPGHPLWDTELNFGLAGPGAANPHQAITSPTAEAWTIRAYLDALRMGVSRVYWYYWSTKSDLVGIEMSAYTPANIARMTLARSLNYATFTGCTNTAAIVGRFGLTVVKKKTSVVTCTFTTPWWTPRYWVWNEGAAPVRIAVPKGVTHLCRPDGTCTTLVAKTIRVGGPVLLRGTETGD
jgi:polysaccharide biosynthesis protein PslG